MSREADQLRSQLVKSRYLVVYDYSAGGVWAYVAARSEVEIIAAFPELEIVHERPGWMDDDLHGRLGELDIDTPTGLLADILAERE
jgi:hypothetical protein